MKTNYVASWRPGADKVYSKNIDVQKVAQEMLAIKGENSLETTTAEEIVNMARDENTESHKIFEWDDSIAAEKYRVTQARYLMHDVHIIWTKTGKKKENKTVVPVRMFYNLKGELGYHPTPVIMKNDDLHKKLLMTARAELEAFKKKYEILSELKPLLVEIDKVIYELKIFEETA